MNTYGTILIIDDNAAVRTALRICLAPVFQRIIELERPDSVIRILQQEPVDVILLDMNFNLDMNSGTEGMQWLRTIHRLHAHIPVILITAYADIKISLKYIRKARMALI